MTSLPARPAYFDEICEGAAAYAHRLRLPRLVILSNEGRPLAVVERRGEFYRIDAASPCRGGGPAINLALVRFACRHLVASHLVARRLR